MDRKISLASFKTKNLVWGFMFMIRDIIQFDQLKNAQMHQLSLKKKLTGVKKKNCIFLFSLFFMAISMKGPKHILS